MCEISNTDFKSRPHFSAESSVPLRATTKRVPPGVRAVSSRYTATSFKIHRAGQHRVRFQALERTFSFFLSHTGSYSMENGSTVPGLGVNLSKAEDDHSSKLTKRVKPYISSPHTPSLREQGQLHFPIGVHHVVLRAEMTRSTTCFQSTGTVHMGPAWRHGDCCVADIPTVQSQRSLVSSVGSTATNDKHSRPQRCE